MTRRHLAGAAAFAAALSLGGCAAVAPLLGGQNLAEAAPQSIADARRALAVAHLAYQAVGVSLKEAAGGGALHGAQAAAAQSLYDQAGAVLDAADQADAFADAQGVFAGVTSAIALIARLDALMPKK